MRCPAGVTGTDRFRVRPGRRVKNQSSSRRVLERPTKAGDSPVGENVQTLLFLFSRKGNYLE